MRASVGAVGVLDEEGVSIAASVVVLYLTIISVVVEHRLPVFAVRNQVGADSGAESGARGHSYFKTDSTILTALSA